MINTLPVYELMCKILHNYILEPANMNSISIFDIDRNYLGNISVETNTIHFEPFYLTKEQKDELSILGFKIETYDLPF